MSTTMTAAVYHGQRDLRVERRPIPQPGPGELLLRIHAAGVCGTDAAEWRAGPRVYASPTAGPHPVTGHRGPLIPGHELAGHVVARGAGVESFRDGALVACAAGYVVAEDRLTRSGRPSLSPSYATVGLQADGGFAQYCAVPARACLVAEGLPADAVALAQPMAIAVHAIRRGRLAAGERAAVVGVGGVGAFVVAAAAAHGARVVAIDLDPARLALARRLGAEEAVAPDTLADAAELRAAPVDVVFEASGATSGWELAAAAASPGARIVVVGLQDAPRAVDLRAISQREHELIGTNAHNGAVDLPEALRLLAARQEGWGDIAPTAVPLAEIVPSALLPLAERRAASVKTLVDPWAVGSRPTQTAPHGA